jgi:hypothetical protein
MLVTQFKGNSLKIDLPDVVVQSEFDQTLI